MKNNLNKIISVIIVMSSVNLLAKNTKMTDKNKNQDTTISTTANTEVKSADTAKIEQEFDALGGNGVLLEKARALNPEVHTTIIQNRIVDRTSRFEVSGEYETSIGGNTYIKSGTFGIDGQYHINNQWSLGARYGQTYNKLTAEGDSLIDQSLADHIAHPEDSRAPVPDIDYPKDQTMGYVNFYPIYGKLSWLGKSVSHFDIYGQLGYGSISLRSGNTSAMSAGIGMGIWGYEHLTTRLEIRYLDYTAQYFNGSSKLGITTASMQVGWLF